MSLKLERFASEDGRLRVPARVLRSIGMYRGSKPFVVISDREQWIISFEAPIQGLAQRMTVDVHNNLLLRVGKCKAGWRFGISIDAGIITVVPSAQAKSS